MGLGEEVKIFSLMPHLSLVPCSTKPAKEAEEGTGTLAPYQSRVAAPYHGIASANSRSQPSGSNRSLGLFFPPRQTRRGWSLLWYYFREHTHLCKLCRVVTVSSTFNIQHSLALAAACRTNALGTTLRTTSSTTLPVNLPQRWKLVMRRP